MDPRIVELERHTGNIIHSDSTLFRHLFGVYNILKHQGKKEYVCWAGLFHSVYETEYFEFNTPYTRDRVTELIGKQAEQLVYEFCNTRPRFDKFLAREGNWSDEVYADLLDIELANMAEQLYVNTQVKMLAAIRKNLKV